VLERAWREAEEIAAISDNLLVRKSAEDFVREHRDERQGGASDDVAGPPEPEGEGRG